MTDEYNKSDKSDGQQTGTCGCGEPGETRYDNGINSGIHCNDCWGNLVTSARKRSW